MPFVSSVGGTFGYGRGLIVPNNYYTSSSGYYMMGQNTSQSLRVADLSGAAIIRSYTGITNIARTFTHDKDLNSNIYYTLNIGSISASLYRNVVPKGGTAVTQTIVGSSFTIADGSLYGGQCYVTNAINPSSFGGLLFASGSGVNSYIYGIYFNSSKGIQLTYTVMGQPRTNPPYYSYLAVDVVPKLYSGFVNNHIIYLYGDRSTIGFLGNNTLVFNGSTNYPNTNFFQYTIGTNGPAVTYNMIYYPPNKPIFNGDNIALTANRVVIFDNNSTNAYEWQIVENGTSLTWTFLRKLVTANNANYPYSMSTGAYNSIV